MSEVKYCIHSFIPGGCCTHASAWAAVCFTLLSKTALEKESRVSTEDRCERMECFVLSGQELQLLEEAVTLGRTFDFILLKRTI